jgi:AraC-like DNA-binding protein
MSKRLRFFAYRPQEGTMDPLTPLQEDVFADVLQSIHLRSALYCRAHLNAPWGLSVPRREVAVFHIVTAGTCWLRVAGAVEPLRLTSGDLIVLPHGHAHVLTDRPDAPVTEFEDFVSHHPPDRYGRVFGDGRGDQSTLVCGEYQLAEYATNPLYALLPTCLHASSHQRRANPWIKTIVQLVRAEAHELHPGADTVITRLSEVLFLHLIRDHLGSLDEGQTGWLRACRDPQIGQALALIHHQPEERWTVESLALHVGLSRSALSAKFTQLVGRPPLRYLTDVRLTRAAATLRTQPATLGAIARSVGYDSEVAFSKAFKRRFGSAPGAYRRWKPAPRLSS